MSEPLLSVAEARARLLSHFDVLDAQPVLLEEAPGRVLAEDIVAAENIPPFANSSMDGYAVRAADVAGVRGDCPVALPVRGDIPAGAALPVPALPPGAAARIMTGAPLPPGADAVVPVELTDDPRRGSGGPPPSEVRVRKAVHPGENVRVEGEDLRAGALALAAGCVIRPQEVGVLAALGRKAARVVRRPVVAVLSTGDELLGVDESITPGKIRDVNGQTLPALIARYGGATLHLGIAKDNAEEVRRRMDRAVSARADMILSSAGVSVGAFDIVREVVERNGRLEFWRVNMRPGKPVTFGNYRGVPFLGLPGNPVSAMVSFEVFARPAVLKMSGHVRLDKPAVAVRLAERWTSDGRESYLRAVVRREGEEYVARDAGGQGSAMMSTLTRANALVIIPAGMTIAEKGSRLSAWMLDWPETVE